jgi:hypothetical protein
MRGSDSQSKPPTDFSFDYSARPGVERGEIHAPPACAPATVTGDGVDGDRAPIFSSHHACKSEYRSQIFHITSLQQYYIYYESNVKSNFKNSSRLAVHNYIFSMQIARSTKVTLLNVWRDHLKKIIDHRNSHLYGTPKNYNCCVLHLKSLLLF